ncbi:MAG: hypothetical protein MJ175_08335 [Clostridia bacterium]|nr:hypothetical protein [Clostridia bacterium]
MNSKKEILITILFTIAFLLGGPIHIVMNPWDFTHCITQIYYSSLVLAWAVTVHYRIVNKTVRHLMLLTAALFMLSFFFQMCRYRVFETFSVVCRYFWYGYYIPVILVPVLFLFVVLHLHLQEGEKPGWYWLFMLIPSLLLIFLVMTNDLHQLVFRFTDGTSGKTGTYTHGLPFYFLYIWLIGVLILSLCLAIRKCRIPSIGKKLWMPLYFAAYGILIVLSIFDIPKIGDTTIWLFQECLVMIIIGMEESCIQLGLIPANSSYRTIARLADKPFIISDKAGTPVYTADAAKEMFQRTDSVQIHTKPIKGGSVSWAVDLSGIMMLNREIEKTTEIIENRNEYLQTENALKEEKSRLTARNTLYNQIAGIVSPQLDKIGRLLDGEVNDAVLAKIAFYNAYIKRRSNMELMKSDLKHFPTEELASAIRESCEYLNLCGVNAMLHITPEWELSADTQLFLYEAFETVVEGVLDTLQFLLIMLL